MEEMVFGNNERILRETLIPRRSVICRNCNFSFTSADVKCFEHNADRVIVFCPQCKTENRIFKSLTR